ncbi:MAG: SlyX family protein [Corallincola sp.]|nr:SlyX family protein [Corallincola sp.]
MNSIADLEQRLNELESRLAFSDDAIHQLNSVITNQDLLIAQLEEKIRVLGQRLQAVQVNPIAAAHEETPPPHY